MANEARVDGGVARRFGRQAASSPRPPRVRAAPCWDGEPTTPVEIIAPDRESAGLLLFEAVPHFRAELVETDGAAVVVRLHPNTGSAGWVFELLALVERWVETLGLAGADAHHGGRSYPIPAVDHWTELDPLPAA